MKSRPLSSSSGMKRHFNFNKNRPQTGSTYISSLIKDDNSVNTNNFTANDLTSILSNELERKTSQYMKKISEYNALEKEYGNLLDNYNRNFVSIENYNAQKNQVENILKIEKYKNNYNRSDLYMTKKYLINKLDELQNLKNRVSEEEKDFSYKKKVILKALDDSNNIIENQKNKIEEFKEILNYQEQQIQNFDEKFNEIEDIFDSFQGLPEIVQNFIDDLNKDLENEKIRTKEEQEKLENDKKRLQNNIFVLAEINDKIKNDLHSTKHDYFLDKTDLNKQKNYLIDENKDLEKKIENYEDKTEKLLDNLEIEQAKKTHKKIKEKKGKLTEFVNIKKDKKEEGIWNTVLNLRKNLKKYEDYTQKGENERKLLKISNKKLDEQVEKLSNEFKKNNEKLQILEGNGIFKLLKYNEINKIINEGLNIIIEMEYQLIHRNNSKPLSGTLILHKFNLNDNIELLNENINDQNNQIVYEKDEKEKINHLKFNYTDINNNDLFKIHFEFNLKDVTNVIKYSFQRTFSLPKEYEGAESNLTVLIPNSYEIYNQKTEILLYSGIENNHHKFCWSGTIPKNEIITDTIFYTFQDAKWEINFNREFTSSKNFKGAIFNFPTYFNGGTNEVLTYLISSNAGDYSMTDSIKLDKGRILANYAKKLKTDTVFLKINAVIKTRPFVKIDWSKIINQRDLTNIDNDYKKILLKTLKKINKEEKPGKPLYVRIGNWVHNYLHYDPMFQNKEISPIKVLDLQVGGCYHFSLLYTYLLRANKIQSSMVFGKIHTKNKENKYEFVDHVWVIAKVQGKWLSLDPTLGIFTGKLPVSHIFSHVKDDGLISYIPVKKAEYEFEDDEITIENVPITPEEREEERKAALLLMKKNKKNKK